MLKSIIKSILNKSLSTVGARIVGRDWGPRGFVPIVKLVRDAGISLDQVIDIGASDGSWTRECQTVLPNSKYYLIDPLPKNEMLLQAFQQSHSNVQFMCCGAGSQRGRQKIFHHGDQSSLLPGVFCSDLAQQIEIDIYPLDELYNEGRFSRPDFIKLDVQGHEIEVFRGATRCLHDAKIVQVETHIQPSYDGAPFAHEVICELAKHGFRIFDLCSYVQRPMDRKLAHVDILFSKPIPELFPYGWN